MSDVARAGARQPRTAAAATERAPSALAQEEHRRLSLPRLSLLALAVGVVTGFGAVGFRDLIGLVHNLAFAGRLSFRYDANVFTGASPWGPWVILVPVVGGILVTFLVSNFAPEAKGHGVPEVMDAIYYQQRGDPAGGGGREVAGFGDRHRHRIVGRPRGADHPDRLGAGLDARPDRAHAGRTAHRAGRRRRRRRHRRDVQHPDRRGDVRHRADAARGERRHLPAGGDRDRRGDLHRPLVHRRCARLRGAAAGADGDRRQRPPDPAALRRAGRLTGAAAAGFIRGLHLVEDLFDKIGSRYAAPHPGHADGGRPDVRPLPRLRAVLRRRRRLRDRAGDPDRPPGALLVAGACCSWPSCWRRRSASARARRAASSRPRSSWARRWAARSQRCSTQPGLPVAAERPGLRHGRHGRDGRRRHRRGDDRRRDDLRDDARATTSSCR